jgi:hypothetical protein
MQLTLEPRLPGQGGQAQVLDDERVHSGLGLQPVDKTARLIQFRGLEQVVHGHVYSDSSGMRQFGQGREFGQGKVLRLHARGKIFKPAVHGVGPGGDGGQKTVSVAGRGEDFDFFVFHGKTSGSGPKVDVRGRKAHGAAAHEWSIKGRRTKLG